MLHPLRRYGSFALVVLVYAYIGLVLMDRQHAWISSETIATENYILSEGGHLHPRDLKRALNFTVFENGPRVSRPLSCGLEVLDTKFRAWLWHYLPPRPSLSLTLFFTLFLTPLCLFGLLRNLGLAPDLSRLATALYLASPGCLSCVSLLFRPSKGMTNFSLAACLLLASRLKKENTRRGFYFLIAFIFFSFFWDETALLIYPAVLIFFPTIFQTGERKLIYLSLPFAVLTMYLGIIPWLSHLAGYATPHPFEYSVIQYPQFRGGRAFLIHLLINFRLFFNQSFALINLRELPGIGGKLLCLTHLTVLSGILIARLTHREPTPGPRFPLASRLAGFLVALIIFHTLLMAMASSQIAPIYWYGCYWSLFFTILLALGFQKWNASRMVFPFAALFVVTLLYLFPLMNDTAHRYFYYLPSPARAALQGRMKETDAWFLLPAVTSSHADALTLAYWNEVRKTHRLPKISLPPDFDYLPVELSPLTQDPPRHLHGPLSRQALN